MKQLTLRLLIVLTFVGTILISNSQNKYLFGREMYEKFLNRNYRTYYVEGSRIPDIITICTYPQIFYHHRLGDGMIMPMPPTIGDWIQIADTIYMQPRLLLDVTDTLFEYTYIPEGNENTFFKRQKYIIHGDTLLDVTDHRDSWLESIGMIIKNDTTVYIQATYGR